MKSKSLIEKQLGRKTNSELVETVIAAKKAKGWNQVAALLSGPRKKHASINLDKLEGESTIVVPGKILSQGDAKKVNVASLKVSEKAREKIIKAGGKVTSILEEIKSNPEAKGITIVK